MTAYSLTVQLESSAPAEASKTADGDEEMGEGGGDDEPAAVDARSIYIGNVSGLLPFVECSEWRGW